MADKNIKLRARLKNGIVTMKALLKHPMETGLRKDKLTGLNIPAYHITEISCHRKDDLLFSCQWGPGVSKNPFLSFTLKGIAKGETLTLAYVDSKGLTDSFDVKVR